MDNSVFIRDTIIQKLKCEQNFGGMVSAELNGNYFSAADIAMPDSESNCDIYRIALIKHNPQKSFT